MSQDLETSGIRVSKDMRLRSPDSKWSDFLKYAYSDPSQEMKLGNI